MERRKKEREGEDKQAERERGRAEARQSLPFSSPSPSPHTALPQEVLRALSLGPNLSQFKAYRPSPILQVTATKANPGHACSVGSELQVG